MLFTSEEPTRFGIGCLGSRLLSGRARRRRRRAGCAIATARRWTRRGTRRASPAPLSSVRARRRRLRRVRRAAHRAGTAARTARPRPRHRHGHRRAGEPAVSIEGEGGHAGAVLMPDRRDAFLAGGRDRAGRRSRRAGDRRDRHGRHRRACADVFPGAVNSVPSRRDLEVDVRDIDLGRRDAVLARHRDACDDVAARRRVTITREIVNADPPARCAPHVVDALTASCDDAGLPHRADDQPRLPRLAVRGRAPTDRDRRDQGVETTPS